MQTRKNKKSFLYLLGAFGLTALLSIPSSALSTSESTPTSIVIGFHEYPPYYEQVNEQEVKGMGVDIYRAAFATQGISVVMKSHPIKRVIRKLLTHEINAFSPGTLLTTNPQLLNKLSFEPTFNVSLGWFHPIDKGPDPAKDYTGQKISIALEIAKRAPYMAPYLQNGLTPMIVDKPRRALKMLIMGRIQYASVTQLTGWSILAKSTNKDIMFTPMVTGREGKGGNLAFFNEHPDSAALLQSFKLGMMRIKNDGTYIKILEKYWGKNNIPLHALSGEMKQFGAQEFSPSSFMNNYKELHRNDEEIQTLDK